MLVVREQHQCSALHGIAWFPVAVIAALVLLLLGALHTIGMCCDAASAVTGYHVLGWQFVGEREYYFDVSRGAMKISYNW